MKRSRIFSLIAIGVFAIATLASAWVQPVVDVLVSTARAVKNIVLDGFALAANAKADKERTVLPFVQAKAFKARKDKRERPELSSSWRMVPST